MEDIQVDETLWTMARHGLTARHLGQFNGIYFAQRRLPDAQPWFYRGRAHESLDIAAMHFDAFERYATSFGARSWLSSLSVSRVKRLLTRRRALIGYLDRLPVTLCHHDAFCRNLMLRRDSDGNMQTVAVDWSLFGYGALGEDPAMTMSVALSWLDVDATKADELDQTVFESYIQGLQDMGWLGDVRPVRFGYTAAASMAMVAGIIIFAALFFTDDEGLRFVESQIGADRDSIYAAWRVVLPFLLDLGDEAFQLLDELQ